MMMDFSLGGASASLPTQTTTSLPPPDVTSLHVLTPSSESSLSPDPNSSPLLEAKSSPPSSQETSPNPDRASPGMKHDKSASNSPLLPPCKVCGGTASGFHYGANTCEACKGFFRRSLRRKTEYKCMGNNKCQILGRRKNNTCAKCRWERCIAIGMSKAAIKTGRYTHEKKTRDIVEIKAIEEKKKILGSEDIATILKDQMHVPVKVEKEEADQSGLFLFHSASSSPQDDSITTTTSSPSSSFLSTKGTTSSTSFSFCAEASTKVGDSFQAKSPISPQPHEIELENIIDSIATIYEQTTYFTEEVLAKMPQREKEFLEQQALKVKMFGPMKPIPNEEYKHIYDNTGLDIDGRKAMMKTLIARIESSTKKLIAFAKSLPGFTSLCINDQIALLKSGKVDTHFILTYRRYNVEHRIVHSPSSKIYGIEELTKLDSMELWEMRFKIAGMIYALKINKEVMVMMASVCFLMVDRCKLKDPQMVESIFTKCLNCLLYLLKKYYSDRPLLFTKIVDILTELRNLADKDVVIENLEQVADMELPPLYRELFCREDDS